MIPPINKNTSDEALTNEVPLCVDLDGTLIKSDVLVEGFLRCIKLDFRFIVIAIFYLIIGRARLKAEIARRHTLDVNLLPFNADLLEWLRLEHQAGRRLILCTAANRVVAEEIAAHLGIFEETIASDSTTNLSGRHKAEALEARFGKCGFDYAGNELKDTYVWERARRAVVVDPTFRLRWQLKKIPKIERIFSERNRSLMHWIRAFRLHQWAKNLLIFVPAVVSHQIFEVAVAKAALVAFVCFGACASSTYVVNDLLDLDADRTHARKRSRPFASGAIPLTHGMVGAITLLAAGLSTAILTLGSMFVAILLLYLVGTIWYSWTLKRIAMVDVLTLAGLYTIRVIAGSAAINVEPSFWLLAFSMFMFLSLALVKRYTELRAVFVSGRAEATGRGYTTEDLSLLLSYGSAAGLISVLVLALYVNEGTENLYQYPKILWLLCPLMLYWISRVWRKTHRGELHDDPVVFAIKDRPSLLVVSLCIVLVFLAI